MFELSCNQRKFSRFFQSKKIAQVINLLGEIQLMAYHCLHWINQHEWWTNTNAKLRITLINAAVASSSEHIETSPHGAIVYSKNLFVHLKFHWMNNVQQQKWMRVQYRLIHIGDKFRSALINVYLILSPIAINFMNVLLKS